MQWSKRENSLVIKLWQEGLSAIDIAEQLGNGRTRNSVLGRIFRLRQNNPDIELRVDDRTENKKPRKSRASSIPRVPRKPVPKPEKPVQINLFTPIEEKPAPEGGVSFLDTRAFQCRYVLNTSKDIHNVKCCGASVFRMTSWCREHYDEVFTERNSLGKQAAHLSSGKTQVASVFQFRRM